MTDDHRIVKMRRMNTPALREIAEHPRTPENKEQSPQYPLGGLVHISGIGAVPLKAIQAEVKRRDDEAA